jgi:prephenate dehydrogenase
MAQLFNKAVIVGVGLIGSSVGLNVVKKRLALEVIGVGRHPKNLREAKRRRAIHRFIPANRLGSLLKELGEKDLVILAAPVGAIIQDLKKIPKNVLVTDVGSTKQSIIKEASLRKLRFVGSHPIAGTEKSGAAGGEIDLFKGRQVIITPLKKSRKTDIARIERLWRALGAKTSFMKADRHDRLLAAVSHLPHVAAYALVPAVADSIPAAHAARFAFTGLKGTTRIAASPPEIWRDIFLENQTLVAKHLKKYIGSLEKLHSSLVKKDKAALFRFLNRSQKIRLKW